MKISIRETTDETQDTVRTLIHEATGISWPPRDDVTLTEVLTRLGFQDEYIGRCLRSSGYDGYDTYEKLSVAEYSRGRCRFVESEDELAPSEDERGLPFSARLVCKAEMVIRQRALQQRLDLLEPTTEPPREWDDEPKINPHVAAIAVKINSEVHKRGRANKKQIATTYFNNQWEKDDGSRIDRFTDAKVEMKAQNVLRQLRGNYAYLLPPLPAATVSRKTNRKAERKRKKEIETENGKKTRKLSTFHSRSSRPPAT